ncbi:glycerophosphodiester phosphodiesterase family protein [Rhodoblastus sp. 17X3]|uniref:glycerophosphodiester phosphodiesterase family protein n=1 Tax=Rhodoblastus sp. 17X3 TaxID=3047026 RepID=UPI0024B693EF|nr:glycerophosphodiester phosphodiesterase family protein [Rhodoblastus sp. 17X3]MDI9847025.1 glycerophosphodiester phosphodiesterase family protein [Rhodoblastus sp. 17X3]
MKRPRRTDLSWLVGRPIAHRGLHDSSCGRVENSIGAARAAVARGYAIECDLRLSRDGRVFVFHDDSLERLTGAQGSFAARDAVELEQIAFREGGETIPTLERWLAAVNGAVPLILELKSDFSGDVALALAAASALDACSGPVALKSFDPALIAVLRGRDSAWPLGIVAQSDYDEEEFGGLTPSLRQSLTRFTHAPETRPDFLSWRSADLPVAITSFARACAGTPVMTWTIRSPEQAESARRHADQIIFEGFLPDGV